MMHEARTAIQNGQVKAFILAGGTGWKLWNHPNHRLPDPAITFAKSVAIVANRRLCDFGIEAGKAAGIKQMYMNIFWDAQSIENYSGIDIHRGQGFNIDFIREARLFGTGGSLRNFAEIAKITDHDIVVVMAGDAVHNVNLERVIAEHIETARQEGKPGVTIVSFPVPWDSIGHYGAIRPNNLFARTQIESNSDFEAHVQDFMQKQKDKEFRSFSIQDYQIKIPRNKAVSNFADTCIYVMSGKVINDMMPKFKIPPTLPIVNEIEAAKENYFYDINRHMFQVVRTNPDKYFFYTYLMPEEQDGRKKYWMDIGTREKYFEANMTALAGKFDLGLAEARDTFWTQTEWGWMGKGVSIHPSAVIKGPCIIGDGVKIGAESYLEEVVLGALTYIENNSYLKRVVTQPGLSPEKGNKIGHHSHLTNLVVMGDEVGADSHIDGKGGEFVYSPRNRVVVVPLETETDMPADLKIRKVVEGLSDKDFAHICLGHMPSIHFSGATIERLVRQIEHINSIYNNVKTEEMRLPGMFSENQYTAVVFNGVVHDAAELIVAGWETSDPLVTAVSVLGSGIEIDGQKIKLRTKTSWSMKKSGVVIHVFELTDENGNKPSDAVCSLIQSKFLESNPAPDKK